MTDELLKKRLKDATSLEKKLSAIHGSLNKVPPFAGKARFMDMVNDANLKAHVMRKNLELDWAYRNEA
jgi:hypothetical protein